MFKFDRYVCNGDSVAIERDGFTVTATIYIDDNCDAPDQMQDGFWPSKDTEDAGYVLPENYDAAMDKAREVMRAWRNSEWFYCGVAVTVSKKDILLTGEFSNALWGVEANYPGSGNVYLSEVADGLTDAAIEEARAAIQALTSD
jgi:hypothetical protein